MSVIGEISLITFKFKLSKVLLSIFFPINNSSTEVILLATSLQEPIDKDKDLTLFREISNLEAIIVIEIIRYFLAPTFKKLDTPFSFSLGIRIEVKISLSFIFVFLDPLINSLIGKILFFIYRC